MTKQTKQTKTTDAPKLADFKTKSEAIRHMFRIYLNRGKVVAWFKEQGVEIRYQHVRNVLQEKGFEQQVLAEVKK